MGVSCDSEISFKGKYTKEWKSVFQGDICTSLLTITIFTIANKEYQCKYTSIHNYISIICVSI